MKIILTALVILVTLYLVIAWNLYRWVRKENLSSLEKALTICVVLAWPVFLISAFGVNGDEEVSDSVYESMKSHVQ